MKKCVNTACPNHGTGYIDHCGKPISYMNTCEDYLTETKTNSSVPLNAGLEGLIQLWQERASAIWSASELVRDGNPKLADELDASGLAYEQCAEELSKLNKAA